MEHYPLLTICATDLMITYSDLKQKGPEKYTTIYFEQPNKTRNDFNSAKVDYPISGFYDIVGFTDEEISELQIHLNRLGHVAFEEAIEEAEERAKREESEWQRE
jgi:hypothetical protein